MWTVGVTIVPCVVEHRGWTARRQGWEVGEAEVAAFLGALVVLGKKWASQRGFRDTELGGLMTEGVVGPGGLEPRSEVGELRGQVAS